MKNLNRPFGIVGSWLRNAPFQQLWFFLPGFWRTKTAFGIRCKRLREIRALKQYPLITKEVWIVLEAISKTCASCLTAVSRHLETIKALGCFICFSVSGYPGQTLELVFDLLHETSDIYIYNIWRIRRLHCSITMKLSYLVSPPCKQLSSYLIMASSNVWIPPFNDLDEREFRFVLGSGYVNDFINSGVDLYKILPNPDKFYTVCKYYIN